MLGIISCQNEPILEPLYQTNRSTAKKNVPSQKENIKTMTEDILYYSQVQSMPGLTIYDAPAMYAFSIPQGTGTGQWNYTSAKLVYNSYSQDVSELYIFEDSEAYVTSSGNCNRKYTTGTVEGNSYSKCEGEGNCCKVDNGCIIICCNPA
jgi:hypothetical protein